MPTTRLQHPLDRFLDETQRALETVFGNPPAARDNPAGDTPEVALDDAERRHAAGLMPINHVGEVCAQALYVGQAAAARDPAHRGHHTDAAPDATGHLAWYTDRPSRTQPHHGLNHTDGTRDTTPLAHTDQPPPHAQRSQ